MRKRHTKDEILQKLRETAQKLGASFKLSDFEKFTGINASTISRAFGSWHDAMIAAGLEPITSKRTITKPELIEQAKILASELGINTLTMTDWKKKQICSNTVIYRRFGSWTNFLKEAGLEVGNPQKISNDELLKEMGRLHTLLGKKVSRNDMNFHGGFSAAPYEHRWGSWNSAWSCYLDSPYVMPTNKQQEAQEDNEVQPSGKHYFGDIIDMPGLLNAPVNELGVIYLFALVSKRLGYSIEGIQSAFPDAIAKRKLPGQKSWESVRIEFEYKSSSFKNHGHDSKGCDLIICWEHDWKECPLPVLDLQKVIKGLKK